MPTFVPPMATPKPVSQTGSLSFAANQLPTLSGSVRVCLRKPRPLPVIPGFQVVRELGHGGMGDVYEVIDGLGVTYALKMIRSDRVSTTFIERFKREAKAMIDLDHPGIARIYGFAQTADGEPYFTMRFFRNGTLAERIREFQDDPRKAVEMMIKVAEAVHYLHDRGLIHRDLKPQNILLSEQREPYVSDFGLVKDLDDLFSDNLIAEYARTGDADDGLSQVDTRIRIDEADRATLTAGIVGTLPYMSPEQLRNQKERIGPQTDIWALGVVLYELLCGVRPFDSPTPEIVSQLILKEMPHPPAIHKPEIAAQLERIVLKCLAKEPLERYASARDLAHELRLWLAGDGQSQTQSSEPPVRLLSRRNVLAALVPAGLLAAGGYFIFNRNRERNPMEEINRELNEEGRVELIVDGKPRWRHWILGDDSSLSSSDGGRLMTLSAPDAIPRAPHGFRYLDLADGLTASSFKYTVVARHDRAGFVGIYAGRSRHLLQGDEYHCLAALIVSDVGKDAPLNPNEGVATFRIECLSSEPVPAFDRSPHFDAKPVPKTVDGFRRFELTVTEERFDAIIDDGMNFHVPRSRAAMLRPLPILANGTPRYNGLTPTFAASSGIGIFSVFADFVIKSASIEKLS